MTDNVDDEIALVTSRQRLIEFLKHLTDNFLADKTSWVSHDVDEYLESLAAWLETSHGEKYDVIEPATWTLIAQLFFIPKIYE